MIAQRGHNGGEHGRILPRNINIRQKKKPARAVLGHLVIGTDGQAQFLRNNATTLRAKTTDRLGAKGLQSSPKQPDIHGIPAIHWHRQGPEPHGPSRPVQRSNKAAQRLPAVRMWRVHQIAAKQKIGPDDGLRRGRGRLRPLYFGPAGIPRRRKRGRRKGTRGRGHCRRHRRRRRLRRRRSRWWRRVGHSRSRRLWSSVRIQQIVHAGILPDVPKAAARYALDKSSCRNQSRILHATSGLASTGHCSALP